MAKRLTYVNKVTGPEGSTDPIHNVTADDMNEIKSTASNHADLLEAIQTAVDQGIGRPFTYADFTPEQLNALKVKGDPFRYEDFTPAQLNALKIKGDPGSNGWTPVLAAVPDGDKRVVIKLVDYTGGTGAKPTAYIGNYLGSTGYTTVIGNATNLMGPEGPKGEDGDDAAPGSGSNDSLVLTDQVTGREYNIVMKNGVLTAEEVITSTELTLKNFPFPVGFALKSSYISVNRLPYLNIAKEQARSVTDENDFKMHQIQKVEGVWDFTKADVTRDFAIANGMRLHGHCLIWANAGIPSWLRQYQDDPVKMLSIMEEHITRVMTHFKGVVKSWDVINEPYKDNGADETGGPWYIALGSEWYVHAFRIAKNIDPDCKLFINQFSQEYNGNVVTKMLAMVDTIRAAGHRVDGIGYQFHTSTNLNLTQFRSPLQRFVAKDLIIHISEMDIKSRIGQTLPYPDFMTPELDAQVAKLWKDSRQVYMETVPDHLKWGITMWSVTDKENYENQKSDSNPIGLRDFVELFDINGNPKSNYFEVLKLIAPAETVQATVYDDFTRSTRTGLRGTSATLGTKSLPWEVTNTNDANADFVVNDTTIGLQMKSSTSGLFTYALLNNGKTTDEITFKMKRTQSTVSLTSRNIGCVFRYLDNNNHFFAYVDNSGSSTHWIVSKKVDNIITKLFESTSNASAGDELNVKITPSAITIALNGTIIGTASDNTLSTATKAGFRGRGLYDTYSSWESIKFK